MVLQTRRNIDANANVPVGAPKPSHVRELLLTLKTRLEAQLSGSSNGNGHATSGNGIVYKIESPDMIKMSDWSVAAPDLHDTVVERTVKENISRQLEQVNETLARIDQGKYGSCT